jgi:hypothetical protein
MLKVGRCFNSSPRKLFSKQPLREAANEQGMQGKRQQLLHSAVALPTGSNVVSNELILPQPQQHGLGVCVKLCTVLCKLNFGMLSQH